MNESRKGWGRPQTPAHHGRCSDQAAGTRISVQTVLGHLSAGDELQDVLAAYPRLTRQDVLACLEYGARLAGHSVTFEKIA